MSKTAFMKFCDGEGPVTKPAYVYVASSWRNMDQMAMVKILTAAGIAVYDYRAPIPGQDGFRWKEIDEQWTNWMPWQWREALNHPVAQQGYLLDKAALDRAECGVLVLPCGKSAHLEAGYLAGQGKPVFTLAQYATEPELMQLLLGPASWICTSMDELLDRLGCER